MRRVGYARAMRTDGLDTAGGAVGGLVDRWVAGWAVSRARPATRAGRVWSVEVASESRAVEYVVAHPDAREARELADAVRGRPDVWVTVVGELRADAMAAFAELEVLDHAESLMTCELSGGPSVTSSTEVMVDEQGEVAFARIPRGEVMAATGQVAVVGTDAIVDRIETHPEWRRRGLGSLLMAALTAWAVERGTETGLLVASEKGRSLYTHLGWRDAAPVTTYRGWTVDERR